MDDIKENCKDINLNNNEEEIKNYDNFTKIFENDSIPSSEYLNLNPGVIEIFGEYNDLSNPIVLETNLGHYNENKSECFENNVCDAEVEDQDVSFSTIISNFNTIKTFLLSQNRCNSEIY
ncbi:hypothetical protein DMUE_1890 [Dictyocoela muelleri]|nr:hypothetical protein DMUE_1890 [Dictyocoela muelleri]